MPKTSVSQFEMMVDFMERNGDLSRPTMEGLNGRLTAIRLWEELTNLLNSDATGDTKNVEKWRKVWSDLKNNTKRKKARILHSTNRGGPASKAKLTEVEDRVINITRSQAATGIPDVPDIGLNQEIIEADPSQPRSPSPQQQRSPSPQETSEDCGNYASRKMTSTDTYQLKWHSHSAHLNGSVAALLRSERFTDVVLCTMDGSQIPAHKFILSSCSVYLSTLFDGQRSVMRMGGMLYVVLPSEISTKALKILVEYMYKGETTVSNEVLDTVLKAGEVLKIRGLWQQTNNETAEADKADTQTPPASVNKQPLVKKPDDNLPKLAMKKDDQNKIIKLNQVQATGPGGVTRPMFIGPPKLVFIKTAEGTTQAALRPGTPMGSKAQTILVAPTSVNTEPSMTSVGTSTSHTTMPTTMVVEDSPDESPSPRLLRRHAVEKKYGKKQKTDASVEDKEKVEVSMKEEAGKKKTQAKETNSKAAKDKDITMEIQIKDEPEWDNSSIEEEERSIAEMLQAEMNVKSEPIDEMDIEEESLMYSPLACELCAEVFTVPGAWVRHVEGHAVNTPQARKRKCRSASDDTEETMALLRCDLCQKHFPNPGEWVRHIQSTHTETEGEQSKSCSHCKKLFPSHASMLIHLRTHTGERPFVCGLCNKGFNVKSNLLRHLRTLHDQIISPAHVDTDEEAGPSEVKREI